MEDFYSHVVAFEKHWGPFVRRLVGCPDEGDMNAETCKPHNARLDRKEFKASRNEAKQVFDLEDK